MISLYLEPYPKNINYLWSCPRTTTTLIEALQKLYERGKINLAQTREQADFIIWSFPPQFASQKWNTIEIEKIPKNKLICVDNCDENNQYFLSPEKCFLYFKRSLFKWDNHFNRQYIEQPPNVFPWAYSVMDGFDIYENIKYENRPIDIGCYLRPSEENRNAVLNLMENLRRQNPNLNIKVGPVSNGGRSKGLDVEFNHTYFSTLQQTKISIVSQPLWIGSSREYESISQGCCTFIDAPFFTPNNLPINHTHFVEYSLSEPGTLMYNIKRYVEDQRGAADIAKAGYEWAMQSQRSINRVQYILDKIENPTGGEIM